MSTNLMTIAREVNDRLATSGACPCVTYPEVSQVEGFEDATDSLMSLAERVVGASGPEDLGANVFHLITLILAVGHAAGVESVADNTLLSITVPDSLAGQEWLAAAIGERPDDN